MYINIHLVRKQPFADVLQNSCSYEFWNIHRETSVPDVLLNKVAGLQPTTLLKNYSSTVIVL